VSYRLGLCVSHRTYRQDYETLCHILILSKHHHHHHQERKDLLARIRDGKDGGTLTLSDVSKMGMSSGEGGFTGGSIVDKTIAAVDPDCLHEVVIEVYILYVYICIHLCKCVYVYI
jgi:hypothetical protein